MAQKVLNEVKDHKVLAGVALAGVAYALYEHHETSKQEKSGEVLHIKLLSGHDLLSKDRHLLSKNTSDPYVKFKQGHFGVHSTTISKNLNPVWNEEFHIPVLDRHQDLEIEVFDKDLLHDDKMGHAKVNLSSIGQTPEDHDIKLHGDAGLLHLNHGHLKLQLWFSAKK
jgi:Ca2+-dependent lipid-binding protein